MLVLYDLRPKGEGERKLRLIDSYMSRKHHGILKDFDMLNTYCQILPRNLTGFERVTICFHRFKMPGELLGVGRGFE